MTRDRIVRLEVDLDELAAAIAESVAAALFAQGYTVARVVSGAVHARDKGGPCECGACTEHGELLRGLSRLELERAFAELGNNTAGGLMAFAEDEYEAGCSCGWKGPADRVDDHDCPLPEVDEIPPTCGTVIGRDDGTTFRCLRDRGHGGRCM